MLRHVQRHDVVNLHLGHLTAIFTGNIFVIREIVRTFDKSVIGHAREPHGVRGLDTQLLVKLPAHDDLVALIGGIHRDNVSAENLDVSHSEHHLSGGRALRALR